MTPTTRPTIDAALTQAGKLKTLRENLEAFRTEQQRMHQEALAALQGVANAMQADTENRRESAIVDATTYCCQKLGRRFRDIDGVTGIIALAVCVAYPAWKGSSSFNTLAFAAARRALQNELGKGVVTPSRKDRRANVRATLVDISKVA